LCNKMTAMQKSCQR